MLHATDPASLPTNDLADLAQRLLETAPKLPGHDTTNIIQKRHQAAQIFSTIGFPNRKTESWHFTPTQDLIPFYRHYKAAIFPNDKTIAKAKSALAQMSFAENSCARFIFIDGFLIKDLGFDQSDHTLTIQNWRDNTSSILTEKTDSLYQSSTQANRQSKYSKSAHPSEDSFSLLNFATMSDGLHIQIMDNSPLSSPVEIICFSSGTHGTTVSLTHQLDLAADSSLTLIEYHHSLNPESSSLITQQIHCKLADGAKLSHSRVLSQNNNDYHVSRLNGAVQAQAKLKSFSFCAGAQMMRHEAFIRLQAKEAFCDLSALYLSNNTQIHDHTFRVDHEAANTNSKQLVKGVATDQAKTIFQGQILVAKDAQHIEGNQLSRGLLLSDKASIQYKPELEIFANDVTCSHGATIGNLDETALFYFRSRGIPELEAKKMLTFAFIEEVLNHACPKELRLVLDHDLHQHLPKLLMS